MEESRTFVEHHRKGMILLSRGEYGRAIEELTAAVELKPAYPDLHNALGIAHFFAGSREMAVEHFKRACEMNSGYLEARLHLAYTLIELGRMEEGAELLEGFLEATGDGIEPREYERVVMCSIHVSLGDMYEKRGELLEAGNEYRKALRLKPGYVDVRLKLARIYTRLELFEEAHREFDRILAENRDYHEARMELGMLFMKEGDYEEARRQWEKCLGSEEHRLEAELYLKRLVRGDFAKTAGKDVSKRT